MLHLLVLLMLVIGWRCETSTNPETINTVTALNAVTPDHDDSEDETPRVEQMPRAQLIAVQARPATGRAQLRPVPQRFSPMLAARRIDTVVIVLTARARTISHSCHLPLLT